jgi:hypothetical protein
MKLAKKLKTAIVFSIILLMAFETGSSMPVTAQTNLRDGGSIPLPSGVTPDVILDTIAHMSFRPNPVGIGQSILINVWLQPPSHVSRYFKDSFQITLTKPDGTRMVTIKSSYVGDSTSYLDYTVDQVGNWTVKFDFLGAYFPPGNYTSYAAFAGNLSATQSVYYKPSSDGPRTITVQQAPAQNFPIPQLPTDYWTRPVSIEYREWWSILGNYPPTGVVGGGQDWPANTNTYMSNYKYVPYVPGPKTPHIVWRREDTLGGLIGGSLGIEGNYVHFIGGTYTGYPSIIYYGRCYGTTTRMINGIPTSVWECYDLRTGQIYWDQVNVTRVPTMIRQTTREVFQIPGEESSTLQLKLELMYVGGGVLTTYDPMTGAVKTNMSISPITTGTCFMTDADGMPLFLSVQNLGSAGYRLINWTWTGSLSFTGFTNLKLDIKSNITWPFSSLGTVDYMTGVAVNYVGINSPASGVAADAYVMGASLTTGQLLWNVTAGTGFGVFGYPIADHGIFALRFNDGRFHAWDLLTGRVAWVSELSSWPWGTFGDYGISSYGGNIIYPQYDGIVAYNWTTGKVSWKFSDPAISAFETPYTDWNGTTVNPFFQWIFQIADGTFYIGEDEHSISNPIPRGYSLIAVNATTGEFIWRLDEAMRPGAIADGYIVADSRDGYIYSIGKGQSATTVATNPEVITKGSTMIIQGTVADQSPATQTTEKFAPRTPSIVPCVSKDSMATYMDYLYLQRPIDGLYHNLTITGVPVKLTAIGSDGTVVDIGTATTNGYYGTFGITWTPPKEDTYMVTATFAGDDSYGSSSAATVVSVSAAPTATATTAPLAIAPDYTTTILAGVIAVIIAVAIVGALIMMMLKKRQ